MTRLLDPSRIRGICFDLDGTLADTDDAHVARLVRLLRPFSALLPNRQLEPFARRAAAVSGHFIFSLSRGALPSLVIR